MVMRGNRSEDVTPEVGGRDGALSLTFCRIRNEGNSASIRN